MLRVPQRDECCLIARCALAAPLVEHLFRRAGFGLTAAECARFARGHSYRALVDSRSSSIQPPPTWTGSSARPATSASRRPVRSQPNTNIGHARQRWLFRHACTRRRRCRRGWRSSGTTTSRRPTARLPGDVRAGRCHAADGRQAVRGLRPASAVRSSCSASTRSAGSGTCSWPSRRIPAMLVWLDGITNTQSASRRRTSAAS